MAALKRLPILHHSADYIFWSFGIVGLILSPFENRVSLKPVLGGVGSVAPLHYCTRTDFSKTGSPMFVSLRCSLLLDDLHSEFILLLEQVSHFI